MPRALSIPQPCSESWDAMTPTATGRHCAACQKTVVDFTQKTDAEILAYLANALSDSACGRFAVGQLSRPLLPAAPAAPTARWRAWLAATLAVWGVREAASSSANAQAPMEVQRKIGKPVMADHLRTMRKSDYEGGGSARVVRGVVLDSATHEGLPGVTVLIKNSTTGVSTDRDVAFELILPAEYADASSVTLRISALGYSTEERNIRISAAAQPLEVILRTDNKVLGEVVMTGGIHFRRPWPWHPRRFYNWGKYWVTRSFRVW